METIDIHTRRQLATPRGIGIAFDFYAARAENATLWDLDGKEYIDFAGGIAVLATGHRHPKVIAAVAGQLDKFTHTAYQIVPYESYISLAEKLSAAAPILGLKKAAFFTTGAEANENALKIARAHTGRSGVISFTGGFHGRTHMTASLTGKVAPYKLGIGPMVPDVFHIPFPNATQGITVADSLKAIELLFKSSIEPTRIAAIIIEPVQGEGGFNITPPELMVALRTICDEHGIVFIADEVQTGFARTGKMLAMEHYSVRVDLITMAKSLAGGLPLSGVVGKSEIMDALGPGCLGGTYAGNPLSIAAALAVQNVIQEENLCDRATTLGNKLVTHLERLQTGNKQITNVRNLGSMVACELVNVDGKPDPAAVSATIKKAAEKGLILLSCGAYGNVLRFLYPLTIPNTQFDRALDILSELLA